MQAEPKNIVKSIFGRDSLLDVSKDEIRKLAEEFPYSPVIQYLLTRRLKISSDPGYGDSVARTAVYFNNPHWLSQLLRRQTADERMQDLEESLGLAEVSGSHAEPIEARLQEEDVDAGNPEVDEEDLASETAASAETAPAPEGIEEPPATGVETFSDAPIPVSGHTGETQPSDEASDEGAGYLQTMEEGLPPEGMEDAGTSVENEGTGPEEADNDDDASVATGETTDQPLTEKQAVVVSESVTELPPSPEEQEATGTETKEPLEERPMGSTEVETPGEETDDGEASVAQQAPPPMTDLPDEKPAVAEVLGETEEIIPIQPMHTMDYFASQGVGLEEEPTMRLDTKARGFTGWLRAMKPVHPVAETASAVSAETGDSDRSSPEEEDDKMEILTEAMAEVYAKQGLRLKAIDVYRKLSLLHPDKSSIFAAKIDQLKGISS